MILFYSTAKFKGLEKLAGLSYPSQVGIIIIVTQTFQILDLCIIHECTVQSKTVQEGRYCRQCHPTAATITDRDLWNDARM